MEMDASLMLNEGEYNKIIKVKFRLPQVATSCDELRLELAARQM